MYHLFSQSMLTSMQGGVRLGVTLLLLSVGPMLLPAHAQAQAIDNGTVASSPSATNSKTQLFVNSNTGKDDLSAGRSEGTPFKTISYALSQATSGTTVQVASGLYTQATGETFPLIVPSGVTVQGNELNQGNTVTVMGGGRFASSWWGSQDVAFLAKSGSQIIGFTVTNPNSRGTGVWIEASNVAVRSCSFTKSAREGVFVAGSANPTIENNLFVDNSANGIALTGKSAGMVRNNLFQKTGFGIAISETASPQVINNRVQDNVDGIVVSHSATPHLRGNIVEGSRRDGLVLISKANPDLGSALTPGRNTFRSNRRYAVYNATASNTISVEGNDISGAIQPTALGPSSMDQDTPPEALTSGLDSTDSGNSPKAQTVAETPAKTIAATPKATPAKAMPGTVGVTQSLDKAQTIQYKGKTYVLLDSVIRLAK